MADPLTGEIKKRAHSVYPNASGTLTTGGGLVFTAFMDGSFVAYDDTTLDQLWRINVGTGFNAPPINREAGGKQYIAILSGISNISKGRLALTRELREQRNQTMLFVFHPVRRPVASCAPAAPVVRTAFRRRRVPVRPEQAPLRIDLNWRDVSPFGLTTQEVTLLCACSLWRP